MRTTSTRTAQLAKFKSTWRVHSFLDIGSWPRENVVHTHPRPITSVTSVEDDGGDEDVQDAVEGQIDEWCDQDAFDTEQAAGWYMMAAQQRGVGAQVMLGGIHDRKFEEIMEKIRHSNSSANKQAMLDEYMSEVDKAMSGTEESHVGVIVRAAMADTCYALGCRVHPSRWDWSHLVEDLDMDWVSEGVLAYMHDPGWGWHADKLHDLEEADPWHECHWVGFGGGIPLWQKGVTCGSDVEGLGLKYQKGLALLGIVVAEDFCSFGQAGLVGWREFREHWGAHEGALERACRKENSCSEVFKVLHAMQHKQNPTSKLAAVFPDNDKTQEPLVGANEVREEVRGLAEATNRRGVVFASALDRWLGWAQAGVRGVGDQDGWNDATLPFGEFHKMLMGMKGTQAVGVYRFSLKLLQQAPTWIIKMWWKATLRMSTSLLTCLAARLLFLPETGEQSASSIGPARRRRKARPRMAAAQAGVGRTVARRSPAYLCMSSHCADAHPESLNT